MKYLLNKNKILFIIWIPIFTFILIITLYRTNYSVITTGDITNLSTLINVEGEYNTSGSMNSVFVYSNDRISLFQKWATSLDPNAYLYTESDSYLEFSDAEIYKMGVIQKNQSIEASVIAAYNSAKEIDNTINIPYTFKGLIVSYLYKSDGMQFKLGDIITSINGVDASSGRDALKKAYKGMLVGSSVKILRDGVEYDLVLNESSSLYYKDDSLYTHINYYEKYDVKYSEGSPKISIGSSGTTGPSAGLMQTLAIYNKLTETDYTYGMRVVGTGTIDLDGNVGEIGGIEQKVVAAFKNNADIFLCPLANYSDGYKQYQKLGSKRKSMAFVCVHTFSDALEALANA